MTDESIKRVVREFLGALVARDVEKALTFLADDASYTAPEGTFAGKDEVRRYLAWILENLRSLSVTPMGIGLTVSGNVAVYEHTLGGTYQGIGIKWPALCVYEFSGDKIQVVRTVYDRLSFLKQAALRWPANAVVGYIAKQAERGLP